MLECLAPVSASLLTGMYKCACCEADLFSSDHKFDSGTGWPSFFETSGPDNVVRHSDRSFGMVRTEVLCRNCDAHLGEDMALLGSYHMIRDALESVK